MRVRESNEPDETVKSASFHTAPRSEEVVSVSVSERELAVTERKGCHCHVRSPARAMEERSGVQVSDAVSTSLKLSDFFFLFFIFL